MKLKFKEKIDEFQHYISNIQQDLEDDLIKRNREKANMKLEMDRIYLKVKHVIQTIGDADKGLENMAQVVACLVENSMIQQALEYQDEVDRKQISLMGYKESFSQKTKEELEQFDRTALDQSLALGQTNGQIYSDYVK